MGISTVTVSIHASRTGGDAAPQRLEVRFWFQSTPPAREATQKPLMMTSSNISFNPRLPHGRRPAILSALQAHQRFQSTPPAREATISTLATWMKPSFQSTPPAREATANVGRIYGRAAVSIHASRTGGDLDKLIAENRIVCFNPRLPHGRRRLRVSINSPMGSFQSTPPAREATYSSPLARQR